MSFLIHGSCWVHITNHVQFCAGLLLAFAFFLRCVTCATGAALVHHDRDKYRDGVGLASLFFMGSITHFMHTVAPHTSHWVFDTVWICLYAGVATYVAVLLPPSLKEGADCGICRKNGR